MVFRIIIDLSHYERIRSLPDSLFNPEDYLFSFINTGERITDLERLQKHDLLLLGDPKPKYQEELLFIPDELRTLKKYVKNGGKILLTSSNRGDFNLPRTMGSLRVLYKLTGVEKFNYSLAFAVNQEDHFFKKSVLRIPFSSSSLPFKIDNKNFLGFGRSTYLSLHSEYKPIVLLKSPSSTWVHDYQTKKKYIVGSQPLLVYRKYYNGFVVTSASSSFLSKNIEDGFGIGANKIFLQRLVNWMLSH
ncbi:MAG: hypothetical protein K9W44_01360 [Candidatus Lokiarchaeota archaeon]|nr:hypothetical protein [Candidatus Harpocratesius repetitus]